jgi:hypothetical protein
VAPRTHAHAAGHDTSELLDRLPRRFELVQGPAGVLEQDRARAGGERALAHALQQRHPEVGFEQSDVMTHRGLAAMERPGGAREFSLPHDLLEGPHVGQVHGLYAT